MIVCEPKDCPHVREEWVGYWRCVDCHEIPYTADALGPEKPERREIGDLQPVDDSASIRLPWLPPR